MQAVGSGPWVVRAVGFEPWAINMGPAIGLEWAVLGPTKMGLIELGPWAHQK